MTPLEVAESLNLRLSEDDDYTGGNGNGYQNLTTSITSSTTSSAAASEISYTTKQKKSFWLKKAFRNPVVNNNPEDEDLKMWPRKKTTVTFANELFIDEVRDINDNSSVSRQSNFISDFNDMYKFTLISPRRNRQSKS